MNILISINRLNVIDILEIILIAILKIKDLHYLVTIYNLCLLIN